MRIEVEQKRLESALERVVPVVATSRRVMPIWTHLYLEALEGELRLVGSNGEQWVESKIPVQIELPGTVVVPAEILSDLVSLFRAGRLRLESGDRYGLILSMGDSSYHLAGLPHDQYPFPPRWEGRTRLTIPFLLLREMVDSVLFAVSKEEFRTVLTGVLMEYDGRHLRLVATDTYRLAVREELIGTEPGQPEMPVKEVALVPFKAVQLLRKLPETEAILVQWDRSWVAFIGEGTHLITKQIEGQYPNYQRVIPQEFSCRWVLETEPFREALHRAYLIARTDSSKVILRTEGEKLVITAQTETSFAKEVIPLVREGDDLQIAFNAKYLLDLLSVLESRQIAIELTDSSHAAVFRPLGQEGYLCVIMPMAIVEVIQS